MTLNHHAPIALHGRAALAPRACRVATMLACGLLVQAATAQPQTTTEGPYTVRASTVRADSLPEEQRRTHGIPMDSNTAVLNVTVQRQADAGLVNSRADIKARVRDLAGMETHIDMRELQVNGFVSYYGVYNYLQEQYLRFEVDVKPADSQRNISLQFEDRLRR